MNDLVQERLEEDNYFGGKISVSKINRVLNNELNFKIIN